MPVSKRGLETLRRQAWITLADAERQLLAFAEQAEERGEFDSEAADALSAAAEIDRYSHRMA